jgi:Ca2+-binding EF-hand superfamily protein
MGLPPPGTEEEADAIVDAAFKAIDADASGDVSPAEFASFMKGVLKEIAAGLRATPVVVESATFDGELIFRLLDDKDAPGTFDAMCESMFAELDADESGALSKQELRPLIAGIGAEMGVPPEQPESAALFEAIFETADFDMSKQIEVSEFKELMRSILQTMAENLRDAPVTVTSSSTAELDIFDGQALRALLDDTDRSGALKAAVEEQFKALDINEDGRLSLEELRSAINAMTASEDDVLPLPLTGEGGNEKAARALTNSVTKVFEEVRANHQQRDRASKPTKHRRVADTARLQIDTDHSGDVDIEEVRAKKDKAHQR